MKNFCIRGYAINNPLFNAVTREKIIGLTNSIVLC